MVNSCTDTIINGFMIIAMLIGFFQIRHLDFISTAAASMASAKANVAGSGGGEAIKHDTDTVMIVTAFGMFVYSTFTIIAGRGSVRGGATGTIPLIPTWT